MKHYKLVRQYISEFVKHEKVTENEKPFWKMKKLLTETKSKDIRDEMKALKKKIKLLKK